MHKKLGMKEYDQCVTCLADDPQTLETRSSTLRTPGFYRKQTIAYISNKHRCIGKTQIRKSNLKIQLKSFDLQKESIESELRNSNYDQNKFGFKFACNQILNCQNHVQVG